MKKILFVCLGLFCLMAFAAPQDPIREEMQKIDKQLQQYNRENKTEKGIALLDEKLKQQNLSATMRTFLYQRKLDNLRTQSELLDTLKKGLEQCDDADRVRLYNQAIAQCPYLYAQRVETANAVVGLAFNDKKLKETEKFDLLVQMWSQSVPKQTNNDWEYANRIYQIMELTAIPDGTSDITIANFTTIHANVALKRSEHWLQEPSAKGYGDAIKIIDKGLAKLSPKAENPRIDLLTKKCECLRGLKKYAEADTLAMQCMAKLNSKETRRLASLTAIRAGCAFEQEKWQEAYDLYGSIDARYADDYRIYRAQSAMAMGKYKDAYEQLNIYIQKKGKNAERMYGGGLENLKRMMKEQEK